MQRQLNQANQAGSASDEPDVAAAVPSRRLQQVRGLAAICAAALCWVITAFALADSELSPYAFLGGSKALFVLLAIVMTIIAAFKARVLRRRE